jgi:hypothetical protein
MLYCEKTLFKMVESNGASMLINLSKIDLVVSILPVLGALDVLSTLFAAWRGYPIHIYEVGPFASYFAHRGLLYLYVFLYLGILSGVAVLLVFMRREVTTRRIWDRLVLIMLVLTACLLEAAIVNAVVSNLLLGLTGSASPSLLVWLVYASIITAILVYTFNDLRESFGLGDHGKE